MDWFLDNDNVLLPPPLQITSGDYDLWAWYLNVSSVCRTLFMKFDL